MLGAPRQIGRDERHAEGKGPLDARLLLAPSRRLRKHVPRLQCRDEQTRSNDKPAAQFDP